MYLYISAKYTFDRYECKIPCEFHIDLGNARFTAVSMMFATHGLAVVTLVLSSGRDSSIGPFPFVPSSQKMEKILYVQSFRKGNSHTIVVGL